MSQKTHLDPEHRLQLELANERVNRANAESRAAAAFVEIAQLRAHLVRIEVSNRYGLVEGDHMNFDTGAITRAPRPDPTPAPTLAVVPDPPASAQG